MSVNHLPKHFGLKEGAEEFPLMVVVAASYVCNAKCPHCPFTQSDIRKTYEDAPFIAPDIFKKIADECGKHHAYIRVSGGGEPFLNPRMVELIEYAKKAGARVGVITNGSLLTAEKVDRLLAADIDAIEISADAADKETYSRIRVGLNFETLLGNTRYLLKRRNELKSDTKVVVSVVNQKAITDKLDAIIAFWKEIADDVQVRKYLTWGIGDPSQSGDATPYIPEFSVRVPCPFPFERLNIDTRGNIVFCGYDIASTTNFGNVMRQSIHSIWKGEGFNKWREWLLKGEYERIDICRKCPDWKYRSWNYNYWHVLSKAERVKVKRLGCEGEAEKDALSLIGDD